MRPDVAIGFDRLAAAARGDGLALIVSSAFRSDAEQAELYAQNPDPRWVAPPGTSLHRCATELDLGPPSAYTWLATHASEFGFTQRYSWEPWHYQTSLCNGCPRRHGGLIRQRLPAPVGDGRDPPPR
jgi:LAS superfamily LD-carboxypeptidase LdcB